MKKNPVMSLGVLFLLIGIGLMVVGGVFYAHTQAFKETATETVAVITDIVQTGYGDDTTYEVYVRYETEDGKQIRTKLNFYSSGMEEGDQVTVFYDPEDPESLIAGSSWIVAVVFAGMGLIFAGTGGYKLMKNVGEKAKIKKLRENGRHVYADVVAVYQQTSYIVNGKSPFVIVCKAYMEGREMEISQYVWFDPGCPVGSKIAVLYEQGNPANHYVDTEELQACK